MLCRQACPEIQVTVLLVYILSFNTVSFQDGLASLNTEDLVASGYRLTNQRNCRNPTTTGI